MKKAFEMEKKDFDNIIRKNLVAQVGEDSFGYEITDTIKYANYYNEKEFNSFLNEMQLPKYKKIYEAYGDGKGRELTKHKCGSGIYPPKMASVASSSRFCYLALRDGAAGLGSSGAVDFEHGCTITGIKGTAPQLDAYIPKDNIYVEVKCHEIFDQHRIIMKEAYWNLVFGLGNDFGFSMMEKLKKDTFEIPLTAFGAEKKNSMFDMKQFICHLLGIASQKKRDIPAALVYLFFKPKVQQADEAMEIEKVFSILQEEIKIIFGSEPIQQFVKKNNIRLWAVAEYAEAMGELTVDNRVTLGNG